MRRWWALGAAMVVTGASFTGGGAAAKPDGRTVVETYTPARIRNWHIAPAGPWVSIAEIPLRSRVGETFVSVRLDDEAGTLVRGVVKQGDKYQYFCGETSAPVEIVHVREFYVIAASGTCDGSPTLATAGTATITFHRSRGGSR